MSSGTVVSPPAAPPADLNRFIGRQRELAEAGELLGRSRLLTLTGAGGSGKSRLAGALVAGVANDYPEGIIWAELAGLSDPGMLALHLAALLQLPEQPGRAPEDGLRALLQGRRCLLVLDGCEHLIEDSACLADTLLRGCHQLTLLATSREALGIPGERAWLVPPLSLPGDGDPRASEAVQLFIERAREVLPGFELTAENSEAVSRICRRLDGIPLAIELAAARVRILPPDQIADRLGDAFRLLTAGSRTALPRHKTLRKAIDWSYDLLTDREQLLLQRLGVFGGAFTLEAAETVCADDAVPEHEILDGLAALVDKSLVTLEPRETEVRYSLLDTMRQYAVERLREAGQLESWRARQASWALALAEEAAPHIFGGASHEGWLRRLDAEAESIRTAMGWAEEDPSRAETALRFGVALHWYWFARGRFREGRQRLERALAEPVVTTPEVRALALVALGHVRLWQGEIPASTDLREALGLLRPLGDPDLLAYGLAGLGAALSVGGELDEATSVLAEGLEIVNRLPEQVLSCFTRYWLGVTYLEQGRLAEARAILEAALEIGWRIGNQPSIAHPLTILGRVQWAAGDLDYALAAFREALAIHADGTDAWGQVQAIEGIARIRLARGDNTRGVCLLSGAAAIRERFGVPMPPPEQADIEGALAVVGAAMPPATFTAAWDRGQRLADDALVRLALEADLSDTPMAITAELPVPKPPATPRPTLVVRTLGTLEVLRNGTPIPPDGWGSARARDLLLLLLLRRQGMTKDEVGVAFWPEASSAQVRNSFHVTLHRLRKALDHADWVVTEGDRYRLRTGLTIQFDAEEFEQAILLALRAAERRHDSAAADLAGALALYHGHFLEGTQAGDWALDTRDRLHVLATRGWLALSRLREQHHDWPGMAEANRRLVELDGLHEEGYRGLMTALVRQGERNQALRLYARLAERLQRELQIEPDDETAALYERMQRGETP